MGMTNNLGWNAGARTIHAEASDCTSTFRPSFNAIGVVIGFNTINNSVTFREITHGLFFRQVADVHLFSVYESGVQIGGTYTFVEADQFHITRLSSIVQYWQNSTVIYTSLVASTGSVFLDTSLYSAGDQVI